MTDKTGNKPATLKRRRVGKTDLQVSELGFGGNPFGGLMEAVSDTSANDAVDAAFEVGVNYFDTAPYYGAGLSEHRLGAALRRHPRENFVLSTKVGRLLKPGREEKDTFYQGALTFTPYFDYSYDGAMRSLEDSIQRLGIPSIDILLIHDVSPNMQGDMLEQRFREASAGAAKAVNALREQGVIKAIGVGVSDWKICMRFAEVVDMDVFLLAVRYTLLNQEPAKEFLPFCRERNISVIAAAPFVSGILATGAVPGARYMYQPATDDIMARTRAIEAVCANHKVPLMAAALQMPLGDSAVCSVLPGFRARSEVLQAAEMVRHPIPEDFWVELKSTGLMEEETIVPVAA